MPDSSFYAPGGAGAGDLDGLTDVNITDASTDDVLQYDGTEWVNGPAPAGHIDLNDLEDVATAGAIRDSALIFNGTSWEDGDPRTAWPAIAPIGTSRYYFPIGDGTQNTTNAFPQAMLAAIRFNTNVTISKWAFAYNGNGTTAAGNTGMHVRGFIYDQGNTGRPHGLVKDLGYTLVKSSDDVGGFSSEVREITLGSTVNLTAGTVYFVGMAVNPVNTGTHDNADGPQFLTLAQTQHNPFWNNGINPANFSSGPYGFWAGGYYNGSINPATFNYETDTLPNNIQNQIGSVPAAYRIGLHVSAIS
jgi:hypothetical protein